MIATRQVKEDQWIEILLCFFQSLFGVLCCTSATTHACFAIEVVDDYIMEMSVWHERS